MCHLSKHLLTGPSLCLQRRVAVFLGSAPFSGASLDEFLDVSAGALALMRLGEAFAGTESHGLRAALAAKGRLFYSHFHRERLDEMRMRLETEMWVALPLDAGWRLGEIRELQPTDATAHALQCRALFTLLSAPAVNGNGAASSVSHAAEGEEAAALFSGRYARASVFFDAMDAGRLPTPSRAPSSDKGSSRVDGGAEGFGVGDRGRETGGGGLLCSTALNTARFVGRYFKLMRESAPLAAEALRGLLGVVQLYVLTVFSVFWTGPAPGTAGFDEHDAGMPTGLRRFLRSLHAATHAAVGEGHEHEDAAERQTDLAQAAAAISLARLRAPLESQDMFALPQVRAGLRL